MDDQHMRRDWDETRAIRVRRRNAREHKAWLRRWGTIRSAQDDEREARMEEVARKWVARTSVDIGVELTVTGPAVVYTLPPPHHCPTCTCS